MPKPHHLATLTIALAAVGCASIPAPTVATGLTPPAPTAMQPAAMPAPFSAFVTLDPTRALIETLLPVPTLRPSRFTTPSFWEHGQLASWVDVLASAPQDLAATGQWHASYSNPTAYRATLIGEPIANYDPNGFLATLGLPSPKSTGRGDIQLFQAWKLTSYHPDPTYMPGPKGLAGALQALFLAGAHLSPSAIKGFDGLIDRTVMRQMERVDALDAFPYGRDQDVVPGAVQAIAPAARYAAVAARSRRQHPWDCGFHEGGLLPTPNRPEEHFGTYEIALSLGFTTAQATKIATQDFAVDLNKTHYLGPDGKQRLTASGTGGVNGDLHWHYNRAAVGQEDTRIAGARVHLDRAERFARAGRFDNAEEELGIGLHGLQDMTAHAQITPLNHALLGEFPDIQANNPEGVFEAAVITEGYLRLYLDAMVPAPAAPVPAARQIPADTASMAIALVQGNADAGTKTALASAIATLPAPLLTTLLQGGVTLFVAAPGTTPLTLGFAPDLNGDGAVTPGRWVDLNADGVQQPAEIEGRLPDGRDWATLQAAYDGSTRRVFLSASLLATVDAPLRHELAHALDDLWCSDPTLGPRWREARERQLLVARRNGEATFTDAGRDEFIADLLGV